MAAEPAHPGYFADPFLLRSPEGFVAYGSGQPFSADGASFEALVSDDLRTWRSAGPALRLDPALGTDCWAPEVVAAEGAWWMYYSAGNGIHGHHLRVARAASPLGPFTDVGVDLTPDETFAIDAHPFRDVDGTWYLFYARDVLDAERPGTHLAVRRMVSLTELAPEVASVLQPNAEWQLYAADRAMYGRRLDWYTLEGPTVLRREGTYYLFYSGGSWEGPGYGVSYATATEPTGPWTQASTTHPLVLSQTLTGLQGPGHNSLLALDDDRTLIAYHAWDGAMTARRMHIDALAWRRDPTGMLVPGLDLEATLPPLSTGASGRTPGPAGQASRRRW